MSSSTKPGDGRAGARRGVSGRTRPKGFAGLTLRTRLSTSFMTLRFTAIGRAVLPPGAAPGQSSLILIQAVTASDHREVPGDPMCTQTRQGCLVKNGFACT